MRFSGFLKTQVFQNNFPTLAYMQKNGTPLAS